MANDVTTPAPSFAYVHSPNFPDLLQRLGVTLAISTYQAGKLCFLSGVQGKLRLLMRTFDRAMGLYTYPGGLLLGTRNQVWRFVAAPQLLPTYYPEEGYDNLFIPQVAHTTGDVAIHDIWQSGASTHFVNTLFSCVAQVSQSYSFVPIWQPKFITRLLPEDRCHLNGVALQDGNIRYAVALGNTDYAAGWRADKAKGGCVIDGQTREVIYQGLAMPHSPRLYQNKLWILNSGCGEVGFLQGDRWQSVTRMPGFLRGLAIDRGYAFVGLSKARESATFGGLPISEQKLQCGVQVVHLATGAIEAWIEITSGIEEIYDVQLIQESRHPFILGFQKEDINRIFHLPQ